MLRIANYTIANYRHPFVVMEIGCNYEHDLRRAEEMIYAAASAGAHAVKFQTVIPERLVARGAPKFWDIPGCPGETQLEEFKQNRYLTREEYKHMQAIASQQGIVLFSSPEDEESLALLLELDMPAIKISSMNLTHFPLLKAAASSGKPIVLSTGMSSIAEIQEAVAVLRSHGCKQLALLHCITSYPTLDQDANLLMIYDLMKHFPEIPIGYSDHTITDPFLTIPLMASAMGAAIIEKHFTFDKTRPGYDHAISFDYADLVNFMKALAIQDKARGLPYKQPTAKEEQIKHLARRSLVVTRNMHAGEILKRECLDVKRPGTGIAPKYIEHVVGMRLKIDVVEDTVLTWEMIEQVDSKPI